MGLKKVEKTCSNCYNISEWCPYEIDWSTPWGRLGYCTTRCLIEGTVWLRDPIEREITPCFCDSPAFHDRDCRWFKAKKKEELLRQLGVGK